MDTKKIKVDEGMKILTDAAECRFKDDPSFKGIPKELMAACMTGYKLGLLDFSTLLVEREEAKSEGSGRHEHTKLPDCPCCECGKRLNAVCAPDGEGKPKDGDFTLCIYCASLNVFNSSGAIRRPTTDEMVEAATNDEVLDMRRHINEVNAEKERRLKARNPTFAIGK